MKRLLTLSLLSIFLSTPLQAGELAGVFIDDRITAENGQTLILNGMGLREKLWVDVYVGSLYLTKKANNVGDVLAQSGALSIRMDFIYTEVSSNKLIKAWKQGFEKNQDDAKLEQLAERIEHFNSFFEQSAKKKDYFQFDYVPEQGTKVSKNGVLLGTIEGEDFKQALVEIWLGNYPADNGLKKGMLGLD